MNKNKVNYQKIMREVFSYVKIIIISAGIAYFLRSTIVVNAYVPTGSMENTIQTGSRIIINRLAYLSDEPKRGDIVSFIPPDDQSSTYIKRIIALPGETVEGKDGKIYINGKELQEDYIKEPSYVNFGPYTMPEDSYFMMGDNRNNSWDARFWSQNYVHKDDFIGKAEFEFYPEIKSFH